MAEFGDVMAEFHKLPMPAKIAAGGAVAAVALIAYARYRSQAGAASSSPVPLTLTSADTGGGIATNAPPAGTSTGSGASPTPAPTATSTPPPIVPPRLVNGPPNVPPHPVVLPIGPARPVGGFPTAAHAAQAAVMQNDITPHITPPAPPATVVPPVAQRTPTQIRQTLTRSNEDAAPKPAPAPVRSVAQVIASLARGARGG